MDDAKRREYEFRVTELVSYLVRVNSSETVELLNWENLGKLILLLEPADLGRQDVGQNWDVLAATDGGFEKLVLYMRRREPRELGEILRREVLPVIREKLDSPEEYLRRKVKPSAEKGVGMNQVRFKRQKYAIWGYAHDKEGEYLKSVEQKWEAGGFFLGPFWLLIKGGSPQLAVMVLFFAIAPLFFFGINTLTVFWTLIVWISNARAHAGLQAIRLKSLGHVRLGEVSAISHEDAQAQFKSRVV